MLVARFNEVALYISLMLITYKFLTQSFSVRNIFLFHAIRNYWIILVKELFSKD